MDDEQVIISPTMKGELGKDEVISTRGFVSTEVGKKLGVQRREGIVYKEALSLNDAKRNRRIYERLRESGLPVVGFLKIVKKGEGGKDAYYLAMNDLTEGDKYNLIEVSSLPFDKSIPKLSKSMQAQLADALAVMHNAGVVDVHPGLSIAIRRERESGIIHDFVFIDYDNMSGVDEELKDGGNWDFEAETKNDLETLIKCVYALDNPEGLSEDRMRQIYNQTRQGLPDSQYR